MAVLKLNTYPDEILACKARPADLSDAGMQQLIDDMIETMYESNGIGLAAPQVGVSKRLIIVDTNPRSDSPSPLVLINPEIALAEGLCDSEEGCLSVPEYIAHIKRAERVIVAALDRNGNEVRFEATGLFARALQHEIDHLDGVLIVDRLSALKREFFKKRYLKALKDVKAKV
jgi:peptide deformylase